MEMLVVVVLFRGLDSVCEWRFSEILGPIFWRG